MKIANAGVWIDRSGLSTRDLVLVVKLPTPCLKSIYIGSPLRLVVADVVVKSVPVRCVGLTVDDQPDGPLTTFRAYRTRWEPESFRLLMEESSVCLYLFDELERCVARCVCHIDREHSEAWQRKAGRMPTPYIGPYGETIEAAVNIFTEILDKPGSTDLNVTGQLSIPLKLDQWQLITLCGIGSGTFKLDEDEGAGLEQSAHQLTESLFNERAYRSPEVHSGTNIRELTDSLMVFDHGVCLMETKALAVIETDNSLTADQRKRRTTKDIKKALKQLRGAVRQFRRGASICRSRRGIKGMLNRPGELIELPDRDSVVLGLVLITDLECGLDREDVTAWILNASNPKEIYQVLDLTELRSLVGAAKGPLQFFTNLIVRFAQVQRTQNALIRVSIKSE